ncbi:MAG: flavin reductase family protein [Lewinellaceae bacterium]|nr:flavin reductase family protein [Saprospiraceae bacterium]MCB9313634.1 flavin reductase family protein [Lewinellaceae bacterium]HRW76252.1 flavin reductase family protein [Saprospiraceae bacterium]
MKTRLIDPTAMAVKDLHQYILGAVAPRPIAFASTVDSQGIPNLAPYSFFNAFSSNPPVLVFSSNRKVKDNQTKDTLLNIRETGEVVINAVNFAMMRQMALASIEYPAEINEFDKAGFTPLASDLVKPFRVAESPSQMECKVKDIITLGDQGGAGHLIICDVVRIHIHEAVIDDRDRIDPHKMDLVGRMGRAYYVRASGEAIHTVFQPVTDIAIGFDQLPESILKSPVLTGNQLAEIAALTALPSANALELLLSEPDIADFLDQEDGYHALHQMAANAIIAGSVDRAAGLLLLADRMHHQ